MKIKPISFTLCILATAILTACGGGSSSTSGNVDTVSTAASSNLTAIGANTISADANTESFDVLASIGDTWRFTVNKTTGAYTLTPNNSQYALAQESGTLTRTLSGDVVSYALANKISLTQDTRTGALMGSMTVGSQTASVSGTPYQVADASKLSGIYTFMGTTRDKVGGGNAELIPGQLLISNDGSSATLCIGGQVDSSANCIDVDQSDGKAPEKGVISISKDTGTNGGFYKLTIMGSDNQMHDFGNLLVSNGNLGTVLLIDRFGLGNSGVSNTIRVGNFYAVKSQTLKGTEMDGTWKCNTTNGTATLVASGTTNNISNPNETPSSWTEVLTYNTVNSSNNLNLNYPGFMISTYNSSSALLLPLSASMAVVENQSVNGIGICIKQ